MVVRYVKTCRLALIVAVAFASSPVVKVQAAPVDSMTIDEVTFHDDHTIYQDTGSQLAYPTPHWKRGRSKQSPVCYTRNTGSKVSAKFSVTPSNAGETVKIKGVVGSSYVFGPQDVTPSSGTATFSVTEADQALPNEIRPGFSPFNIAWYFSKDNGTTWSLAGTSLSDASSSNTVYVTLGNPTASKLFHTLVHIGCSRNEGETNPDTVFSNIWSEFTDRSVTRVGTSTAMTYYGSFNTRNVSTATLLETGDGQCGAWADFFLDTLKAQSIDYTNEYAFITPKAANGFIVKNWNIVTGAGKSGDADFPYLNIPDSPLITTNAYQWRFAEVTDVKGIDGQGPNTNPASLFNNHQQVFTAINGIYYDPSYGRTFTSLSQVDGDAMAGYFVDGLHPVDEPDVNLDLNGDGDMVDLDVSVHVYAFQENGASDDLQVTLMDH